MGDCKSLVFLEVPLLKYSISHRIHGTGISTYIWLILMVNVGKYTIHTSYGFLRRRTLRIKQLFGGVTNFTKETLSLNFCQQVIYHQKNGTKCEINIEIHQSG